MHLYNSLLAFHGKSRSIIGIHVKNWFKDSILDDISISDDDWYHQSSFRRKEKYVARMKDLRLSSVQDAFETIICRFLNGNVSPEV